MLTRTPANVKISFEFFPPKTEKMEAQLWQAVDRLAPLRPDFMTVTYGAGGSTRERTHNIVTHIQARTGLPAAAHLTCIDATTGEIDAIAEAYWEAGIRHIVALRGDAPGGSAGGYQPHPGGYAYASDLIAGLKRLHDFEISAAAYPETHPHAASPAADIENLKRKVDAGATRAITQFFFDIAAFRRFRDHATAAGIGVPIVPGILPIANFARTKDFAASCGARIPADLAARFDALPDDANSRDAVAADVALAMCRELLADGIDELHFYTLNKAELVERVCRELMKFA